MTKSLTQGAPPGQRREQASRTAKAAEAPPPARAARTRCRPARSKLRSGAPLAPWSAAEKTRFLKAVARTGSMGAALRLCGRTRASAFEERLRDPQFALAWDEATDCELEVLQIRLVARALEYSGPGSEGKTMPADLRAADRLALQILKTCRAPAEQPRAPARGRRVEPQGAGSGRSPAFPGPEVLPVDPMEVQAEIDALFGQVLARIQRAEGKMTSSEGSDPN